MAIARGVGIGKDNFLKSSNKKSKDWAECIEPISIQKLRMEKWGFPIQKWAIFHKVKKINGLRGGVPRYATQEIPPIDAEIAEKGHFWMETNYAPSRKGGRD